MSWYATWIHTSKTSPMFNCLRCGLVRTSVEVEDQKNFTLRNVFQTVVTHQFYVIDMCLNFSFFLSSIFVYKFQHVSAFQRLLVVSPCWKIDCLLVSAHGNGKPPSERVSHEGRYFNWHLVHWIAFAMFFFFFLLPCFTWKFMWNHILYMTWLSLQDAILICFALDKLPPWKSCPFWMGWKI